jgi:hypothetical protein
MKPETRALALAALGLLALAVGAGTAPLVVGDFSAGELTGWEQEEFAGRTSYRIVQDNGRKVLQAVSRGNASALVKKLDLDINQRPILSWSWKIEGVLPVGDGRRKEGDDYAARIYVVFPAFFFWNTRSLSYVWANRLPVGEMWPNAFAGKAVTMIAVDSGGAKAGQWVGHRRDVRADFRRVYGEDPPALGAVAVMTDSDNTRGRAVAYYGDISLSPEP